MMIKNNKFIFKLLLSIQLIFNSVCYIKLDIEISSDNFRQKLINNFTATNIVKYQMKCPIKTSLDIANPPKKTDIFYMMKESSLFFDDEYEKYHNSTVSFNHSNYELGKKITSFTYYNTDDINNNQKISKEISYYINNNTHLADNNLIGIIGLGLNDNISEGDEKSQQVSPFVNQLKKQGLISNYKWFIYLGNEKPELIFGLSPHEYAPNIFNENDLVSFPAQPFKSRLNYKLIFNWNFRVSKIYVEIQEKEKENKTQYYLDLTTEMNIDLDYNSELIIGIQKYWVYCTEKLFKQYLKDKKCFMNITDFININSSGLTAQYYMFYCEHEYKEEIKKNFTNLKFECQECNYTFELTFDDLFKSIKIINGEGKEEVKLLFLVIFKVLPITRHHYHRWIMGMPLLKKYQFFFEQNSKMIYLYRKELKNDNSDDGNSKIINNDFFAFNYKIFIIVVLNIFFILLILFIFYKYVKNKKKKNKQKEKQKQKKDEFEFDEVEMDNCKELMDKE